VSGRRILTAVVAATAGLLAAGCAGVPERSAVVPASRIEAPRVQPFAAPPTSGDTPDGIVKGFIAAGRDFHQNHQVARDYLDDGGAQWQALAPVVVVDDAPCIRLLAVDGVPVEGTADDAATSCPPTAAERAERDPQSASRPRDGQTARVRVTAGMHAQIDDVGRYRLSAAGAAPYRQEFSLVGRGGEWRISDPPPGLVLTSSALGATFSPVPLYFGQRVVPLPGGGKGAGSQDATTGAWLVPDVRWFPTTALQQATTASMAVRALLAGPSEWLADAVTSGAGRGVALAPLAGVQIGGGLARIDLTRAPAQRGLLQAQLLATLQALPVEPGGVPVSAVEITVEQVKIEVPVGTPPALWSPPAVVEAPPAQRNGDKGGIVPGSPLCLTTKGEVGQTRFADKPSCSPRPDLAPLTKAAPAGLPASDLRSSVFAVLTQARDVVYAMQGGQQEARPVVRGQQLTAPSLDGEGPGGRAWVWAASGVPGGKVHAGALDRRGQVTVDVPWLGSGRIRALRVSPDGTRALLVVQRGGRTDVVVSGVVRRADGTPLQLARTAHVLLPDLTSAVDAGWRDPQQAAVLGARSGITGTFVWNVKVGGDVSDVRSAPIPPKQVPVGLAVSGSSVDTYVRTAAGDALVSSLADWGRIAVRAPALPG
jgi:hypothetical protein